MSKLDENVNNMLGDDVEEEEEVEEEVEVLVTDDESDDGVEETAPVLQVDYEKKPSKKPAEKAVGPGKKASAGATNSPGKVNPSEEVKSMKMRTPAETVSSAPATLPTDKNPFPSFGAWTEETFSKVEIVFPILNEKCETTNELTRKSRPESRYWKSPILFKYNGYTSDTLKFDLVRSPYHTAKNYGSDYVYLTLPSYMSGMFAQAGKSKYPTRVNEESLAPNTEIWWKIANRVSNSFGTLDKKNFHVKSLETIFGTTNAGIGYSATLRFLCKASTPDNTPLKPTVVRNVAVEVVRAYINEVDIDVQMPSRVNKMKPVSEPIATSRDVASDSLMKRFSELGL